ncbi:MAG: CDP-alcohol phosphatidyltransferase family protein [Actinobacteria bacterium]|nr:CDP-alcohol phosphatidyltransferase family protein [Actinomycetota bacterium]
MLDSKIRGVWDSAMRPVGRALGATRVNPNAITVLGLIVHIWVAILIVQGRFVEAGFALILAAAFDAFDGAVAKARGMITKFGGFLDSTIDRLADALILLAIAWRFTEAAGPAEQELRWVAIAALVALVAGFLVSYVRARAEALGFECKVGIAERAERVILLIAGLIFTYILPIAVALLAVLASVTVLQRIFHVRAQAGREE